MLTVSGQQCYISSLLFYFYEDSQISVCSKHQINHMIMRATMFSNLLKVLPSDSH